MTEMKQCGHGVSLKGDPVPRCIQCELVWYWEAHNDAARRVITTAEQIKKLEIELAKR